MTTTTPTTARLREILTDIAIDAEADVHRYEHQPFDGRTMAAYQGEQNAMIQALANVIATLLDRIETLEESL